MKSVGKSLSIDYFGCDMQTINHLDHCYRTMVDAAKLANLTVLGEVAHVFHPEGLSIIFLLSESHFSIHSWPKEGIVTVDIFTCGKKAKPGILMEFLKKAFNAKYYEATSRMRGTHLS